MLKKLLNWLDFCPAYIYLFPLILLVTYFSFINGLQSDTLFHIKIGEYVSQFGIPVKDPFSWTTYGKPWVAHEWLWDLMVYQLYHWKGFFGIFPSHLFSITMIVSFSYLLKKNRV